MYKNIRWCGSTVHIYEFNQKTHKMSIETGITKKLEPLSKMAKGAITRVNCGFFDNTSEHYGTWSKDWTTVVYDDNGDQLLHFEESNDRDNLPSTLTFGAGFTIYEEGIPSIRNTVPFPHYNQRHPRTMIAQKPNRNVLLIVADGRRVGELGLTAIQLASLCKYLGVRCAVTFDGGGSSEMMVGEKIVNRPSDGQERSIGSCFAVFKK